MIISNMSDDQLEVFANKLIKMDLTGMCAHHLREYLKVLDLVKAELTKRAEVLRANIALHDPSRWN